MLRHLFTSKARIKILSLFLLNPEKEYFIREITRILDEQINAVRRELNNLKKLGLLRSKSKNRKKYFLVNKNFILFSELRSIFLKAQGPSQELVKKFAKIGEIDLLVMSGIFLDKETKSVDLFIVGDIDREKLSSALDSIESKDEIKFTAMNKEEFLYRLRCKDKFAKEMVQDKENIIAINKLKKQIEL